MSVVRLLAGIFIAASLALTTISAQIPGRNVNMVAGDVWPNGDQFLQRQNEPSIAASTRNPLHLLAGANDYRTVDLPGLLEDEVGDAWLGVFKSWDGGQRWSSSLVPGYPQDHSAVGMSSPIKGYGAGADPVLRAGTNGLMYYAGLVFDRPNPATPDVPGKSAIFVARYIDNNNKEAGDTFEYLGTRALQTDPGGATGNFLDKPWMVVDIPRDNSRCTIVTPGEKGPITQSIPAGALYVAYTLRSTDNKGAKYDVMFTRSTDCGNTWSMPVKLNSNGERANQSASLAIDPRNGNVYIAWRQFDLSANSTGTDALMVVKYTLAGKKLDPPGFARKFAKPKKGKGKGINPEHFYKKGGVNKALEAAELSPLDQSTSAAMIRFRTNAYPSITVDENGRVYMVWAERGYDPLSPDPVLGSARVLMATSADGQNWTTAKAVSGENQKGHQLMPAITYAGGKLMLIYYDLRETRSQSFTQYIDDKSAFTNPQATGLRHTIDLRASMAPPAAAPIFAESVKVSEYIEGPRYPKGPNVPWQVNPPNLPMFQRGTAPFIGDYIDVAAAPNFILGPTGKWIYNSAPTTTLPIFHAAWTDNRDVRVPLEDRDGDGNPWNDYAPPGTNGSLPSIFDPTKTVPQCIPGNAGSRNQNVYTARITGGLLVGSPGNSKTLHPDLQRGFVVFAQNTGDEEKIFRLTITSQPVGGRASWEQFPLPPYTPSSPLPLTVIETIVPRKSTASRTVYVTSSDPHAQINVLITEITVLGGAPVPGGLGGKVLLNPDIDNPDIDNPDIDNPDIDNPDIDNAEVYNPDIDNPDIDNPDIDNPDIDNPDIDNPDIDNVDVANPDIDNPDIDNPDIDNPDIDNPDIDNPDIDNPDIDNASLMTDVSWGITNTGNTTAAYNVNLFFAQTTFDPQILTQLILFRTYKTPVVVNCLLKHETRNVVVANVPNPQLVKGSTGEVSNPNDPEATNATIYLAPGETAKITLRIFDPSPDPAKVITVVNEDGSTAKISTEFVPNEDVTPVVQQQAVDSEDAEEGQTEPPIVVQFPPPQTVEDAASTAENTPVRLNVLANDSAAFGSTKVISFHPAGMGAHSGGGPGDIAFQPSSGFLYTQRGAIDPISNALVGRFSLPPSGPLPFGIISQIANLRTGINYGRTNAVDTTSISALDARPGSETFHQYLSMPVIGGIVNAMTLDAVHGFLYVTHSPQTTTANTPSTLSVIDVNPGSETFHNVVRSVALPLGVRAQSMTVNSRTQRVYIAAIGQGASANGGVYRYDAAGEVPAPQRVPNTSNAWAIAVNESANLVFATTALGQQLGMYVIDGASNGLAVVPTGYPIRFGPNDERLAIHEASGKVYIRLENQVVIFDGQRGSPTRNSVLTSVSVGREAGGTDIAIDQELGLVVTVGNVDFQVDIISVADNALVETIPVNTSPVDVAIDPRSHRAFVAMQLNYVQEIDLLQQEAGDAIPVFIESGSALLNPVTSKAYVGLFTTSPQLQMISGAGPGSFIGGVPSAGRFLYSAWHNASNRGFIVNVGNPEGTSIDPGSVIVIDGATDSVHLVGEVYPNPFGIGIDQETGHIYVASLTGPGTHGNIARGNANNLNEDFPEVTGPNGAPLPDGFNLINPGALIGFGRQVVVNPANHKVYVLQMSGGSPVSLAVLDPATNRLTPLDGQPGTPIFNYSNPGACGGVEQPSCNSYGRAAIIQVDASLNKVFIGYLDPTTGVNRIVALNSVNDTVAQVITAGSHSNRHNPGYMVVNEPSNELYVLDYNNDTIQKYNSATMAAVGAPLVLPNGPSAMAYNVLAKRIYVSSIDDKMMSSIDAGSMHIISSVRLPLVAYFLWVDETESRIYTSGGDSADESGAMVITDVLGQLGTNVSVTSVGEPQHGTAVLQPDYSVIYTPEPGYSGPDQFSYDIAAPTGTAIGTVHITVVGSVASAIAFGDGYSTTVNQQLHVDAPGALGNDASHGGSMVIDQQPEHGQLSPEFDGAFSYIPTEAFTGLDSFTYHISSELGDSNIVTVTINVNPGANLVVTNTNDSGPGSLRSAITTANIDPGSTISFNIAGAGPHVIVPGSPMPVINSPMMIDGYTQPGSSPNTGASPGTDAVIKVHLLGLKAGGANTHGLHINGGGTTVKGLAIGGFGGDGIFIDLVGGNVIEGNFVGTLDGFTAQPNLNGGVVAQAGGNMIGGNTAAARNLISGNTNTAGVRLQPRHTNGVWQGDASGTVVKGNLIGTNAAGGTNVEAPFAIPNGNGIQVNVSNITIGGLALAERNVIAGNASSALSTSATTFDSDGTGPSPTIIVATPDHLKLYGNYMGIKADGSGALPNNNGGFIVGSYSEIVGNVISGNASFGLSLTSHTDSNQASPSFGRVWSMADHTVVTGNIIGLDPSGTNAIGNNGIGLQAAVPDVEIGGPEPEQRNVIAGNTNSGINLTSNSVNPPLPALPFVVSRADGVKASADNTRIRGNYIGLSASGNVLRGNGSSAVQVGTASVTIGGPDAADGNYVALGGNNGISLNRITNGATVLNAGGNTLIQNNVVGLLKNGARTSGGSAGAIAVNVQTAGNQILDNVIAGNGTPGPLAPAGPGTSVSGISIFSANASKTFVKGNTIGTNANGDAGLGNTNRGISIQDSSNNFIGGTAAGDRNVISGNGTGISLDGNAATVSGNLVEGNYIGVKPDGTTPLGNTTTGINMFANAGAFITGNTIGGSAATARNVISGNFLDGIALGGANTGGTHHNTITGNYIGVGADGVASAPNGGAGVWINNATDNVIGGVNATDGNRIANNGNRGITSNSAAVRNRFLSNLISGNTGLGIDLNNNASVNPNDDGDPDNGANNLQNFPVVSDATNSGGQFTSVNVDLSSFIPGNYTIEFFANATCDAGGYGEGERLVGSTVMAQPGSANHLLNEMVAAGQFITATATDAQGNTSEFSACAEIDPPTLVVNNNDSGNGSLRAAITAANAAPGTQTIAFNIPGAGPGSPATISVNTPLPSINESVIIDATTQPGYDGQPVIELTTFEGVQNGLITEVNVNAVTIKGLSITNFSDAGILLLQADNAAPNTGHLIEKNIIGSNRSGAAERGNGIGIAMRRDHTLLKNNVISGNDSVGVLVYLDGDNITIDTNFIGLSPADNEIPLANGDAGIRMYDYPDNTLIVNNYISGNGGPGIDIQDSNQAPGPVTGTIIRGNRIGLNTRNSAVGNGGPGILLADAPGTQIGQPGAGNVISGNGGPGIYVLTSNGSHPVIRANRIGTDWNGGGSIPNTWEGIRLGATAIVGGHANAGEGNLISGNGSAPEAGTGIEVDPTAADVEIYGNVIGLAVDGLSLGNGYSGITVTGKGTIIGGPGDLGNVISGNPSRGIAIYPFPEQPLPSGIKIRNNKIGTDATGNLNRFNGQWGITVNAESSEIGGPGPFDGNLIAFNGVVEGLDKGGIHVCCGSSEITILGNILHSNNGLGIDLDDLGVSANDGGDTDEGPNNRQNFPVLNGAVNQLGPNTQVSFDLSSFASDSVDLQFFSNPFCHGSGHGEGMHVIGTFTNIDAPMRGTIFMTEQVPVGEFITAVAIDSDGNTSEFSNCIEVTAPGTAWAAAGDGTTNVLDNGQSYQPRMTYDHSGPNIFAGAWQFTTVSATGGNLDLEYLWNGFHSFFQVRAGMQVFVNRGGVDIYTNQVIAAGPEDCGACNPPSGGFTYTGTVMVNVQPGDTYGFRLTGSHADGTFVLRGNLNLVVRNSPPQ